VLNISYAWLANKEASCSFPSWANQQVLEACQNMAEDQPARPVPVAYGTIHDALGHIIRSEAGYIRLLTGSQPQPSFQWEDQPSLIKMKGYAADVGEALVGEAKRVRPTDRISEELQGRQLHHNALVGFIQIVNQDIEHRTNITTMLNQEEQTPPDVDGWGYLLARLDRFEENAF
jgi:uncharacterized damage-inducible protein DinB